MLAIGTLSLVAATPAAAATPGLGAVGPLYYDHDVIIVAYNLVAGTQYGFATDVGTLSAVDVPAGSTGRAQTVLAVPGDAAADSVTITLTESGRPSPVAQRTFLISPPAATIDPYPWGLTLQVSGYSSSEPLAVSYSSSAVTGPTAALAPDATHPLRTTDGSPFPTLTGTPRAAAVAYTVTVTGQKYGRVAMVTGVEPGYALAAGRSRTIFDVAHGAPSMLASARPGYELYWDFAAVEMHHYSSPNAFSAYPAISSLKYDALDGCASASLAMQTDGNLVIYCTTASGTKAVWNTHTRGTGTANRLTLQDDGNLVLSTAGHFTLWSSKTGLLPHPSATTIPTGTFLSSGQALATSTGYRLRVQSDGNVVLYSPSGRVRWQSRTNGIGDHATLLMRSDGNLVLYDVNRRARWSSHTAGTGSADRAVLRSDGRLAVVTSSGRTVWITPG